MSNSDDENKSLQEEEILALSCIYPEEFKTIAEEFEHQIMISVNDEGMLQSQFAKLSPLVFQWSYSSKYPASPDFPFKISTFEDEDIQGSIKTRYINWLTEDNAEKLSTQVKSLFPPEKGTVVIFNWIEWFKENGLDYLELKQNSKLNEKLIKTEEEVKEELKVAERHRIEGMNKGVKKNANEDSNDGNDDDDSEEDDQDFGPRIVKGQPVTDRKSKFQAFLAVVHSKEDVDDVLSTLKRNKKIRTATHNIVAYRINKKLQDGRIIMNEDRDDDGETGAGDKLLYMLQRLDAKDVVVVVTRWFGGIMLGPDRFKHIVNVGKELVIQHLEANSDTNTDTKGAKGKTKKK